MKRLIGIFSAAIVACGMLFATPLVSKAAEGGDIISQRTFVEGDHVTTLDVQTINTHGMFSHFEGTDDCMANSFELLLTGTINSRHEVSFDANGTPTKETFVYNTIAIGTAVGGATYQVTINTFTLRDLVSNATTQTKIAAVNGGLLFRSNYEMFIHNDPTLGRLNAFGPGTIVATCDPQGTRPADNKGD
jgi:hypothetical protein